MLEETNTTYQTFNDGVVYGIFVPTTVFLTLTLILFAIKCKDYNNEISKKKLLILYISLASRIIMGLVYCY